jgi:hypothetical protein
MLRAEGLARSLGHPVDPLHIALAMFSNNGTWSLSRFGDPGITASEIESDLRAREPLSPIESERSLANALRLAVSRARTARRPQATAYDLAYATWMSPGPHQRSLVQTRGPVLPVLRVASGAGRPFDPTRVAMAKARVSWSRTVASAVSRARSSRLGIVLKVLELCGRAIRAIVQWIGLPAAFVLTAPGVLVREGSRVIVARLSGTSRRGRRFFRELGTEFDLVPLPRPTLHASAVLVPALITFAVGIAWLIPPLVRRDVLGVSLAPALSRDLGTVSGDEEVLSRLILGQPLAIWIAVACLFVALPPHEHLRQSRWELMVGGPLGRILALVLLPVQWAARIATPIDSFLAYTGVPAIVGTGLVGVTLGAVLAEPLAKLFY